MFVEFYRRPALCFLICFVCQIVPAQCLDDGKPTKDDSKKSDDYFHKGLLYRPIVENKIPKIDYVYNYKEGVNPFVTTVDTISVSTDSDNTVTSQLQKRVRRTHSVTETNLLHESQILLSRARRSISEALIGRETNKNNNLWVPGNFREARTESFPDDEPEVLGNEHLKVSGRQSNGDSDIENVIKGIMKLLGEKVKITTAYTTDTQLTTFTDLEPATVTSRINNRGPPELPDFPYGLLPNNPALTLPPIRPPITPPTHSREGQPAYVANTRPPFLVPLPPQFDFNSPLTKPYLNGIPLPINVLPGNDKETLAPEENTSNETVEESNIVVEENDQDEQPAVELHSTMDTGTGSTTTSSTTPTPSLETTSTAPEQVVELETEVPPRVEVDVKSSSRPGDTITSTTLSSTTSETIAPSSTGYRPSTKTRSQSNFFDYPSLPTRLPDPIRPYHTTGHPGVVLEDSVSPHVITAPLPNQNIFDVTVSAIQGYNGGGRPVIQNPVNVGGSLITSAVTPGDGVFIDGRKSYFNLVPATGTNHVQQTLGVGTVIPEEVPVVPYIQNAGRPVAQEPAVNRPGSFRPTVINKPQKPPSSTPKIKKEETYRPTLGPPKRIDTCIVGYDTTCKKELGEVCRTEGDVSSCFCKPGTARKRSRSKCRKSVVLHLSLKVDRVGDRRIIWGVNYANPEAREYQILSYEAEKALDSAFSQARGMTDLYLGSTVNKFYSLGGRVIVNSTVHLIRTPQTSSVNIKRNLQRHLIRVIQANNNYVGNSVLVAEGPLNPIPDVSDVNECFDSLLNDCHAEASCINTFGSFTCSCARGYTDRNSDNPDEAGRKCLSCSKDFCSKRGLCKIINEEKVCECEDSFYGSRCEIDGEVIAVAVGASVAAVVIIILTLIFLCMWSRKWRDQDRKAQLMSTAAGFFGWRNRMPNDVGYSMNMHSKGANSTYGAALEDRIRWSHMAETLAQQNIYAPSADKTYTGEAGAGGMPSHMIPNATYDQTSFPSMMYNRVTRALSNRSKRMNSNQGYFGAFKRFLGGGNDTRPLHGTKGRHPRPPSQEPAFTLQQLLELHQTLSSQNQPDQMRPAVPMYPEKRKMGPPPSEYASVGTVRSGFPQQFGMHCMNPPTYGHMSNNGPPSFSQFTSTSINAASVGGISRATTMGARTPQPLRDSLGFQSLGPLGGGTAEHLSKDSAHHNESSEEDDKPYHLPRPKSRGSLADDDLYYDIDEQNKKRLPPLPTSPPPPVPFSPFDHLYPTRYSSS